MYSKINKKMQFKMYILLILFSLFSCSKTEPIMEITSTENADLRLRWKTPFDGVFVYNQEKDIVARVTETLDIDDCSTVTLFFKNTVLFTFSYDSLQTTANNPIIAVENTKWQQLNNPNNDGVIIKLKSPYVISSSGDHYIGLKVKATVNMQSTNLLKGRIIEECGTNSSNNGSQINATIIK